jgi:hypothetical protein
MYVVEHHGHSVAWCLGQTDIPRDDGLEYLRPEKAPKIGGHLFRKSRAVVVHREENTLDCERWIDRSADAHERVEQLGDALDGKEFALNRHEHGIAGGKCVESQEIQCRRAVNQYEGILIAHGFDRFLELIFPTLHRHHLNSCAH